MAKGFREPEGTRGIFTTRKSPVGEFKTDDLIKVFAPSQPRWILSNGDWNDLGIWIDEAVWID